MRKYLPVLSLILLVLTCKSPPQSQNIPEPPSKNPAAVLEFERIEASGIDQVALHYRLKTGNPRSNPLETEIKNWKGVINGIEFTSDSSALSMDGAGALGKQLHAEPASSAEKTLILHLDLKDLKAASDSLENDEYLTQLTLELDYRYAHNESQKHEVSADAVFPRIREPRFTITSIAIMQAELINTRFKVSLRIDNPNVFPVALSSFGYELFGDGSFWADGIEKDVLHIPAHSSSQTDLHLIMNFINMKRQLLDDIIAMKQVRYRFSGTVDVGTGIAWLPSFNMDFDRSGNSPVVR